MYEHKSQPLATKKTYYNRIKANLIWAILVLGLCLLLGVLGYHFLAALPWLDSFHNASMILSGMGPILPNNYTMPMGGVVFSSLYAIFSGVVFITNIGFILSPAIHRFFHKLHLEEKE